jgi:hypothetical protein
MRKLDRDGSRPRAGHDRVDDIDDASRRPDAGLAPATTTSTP